MACTSEGKGEGSTFIVALPRLLTAGDECAVPILAPPESKKSPPPMVVDDNVDAATILGLLLESHGNSVIVKHDPHLALARARSERPRVCVLDIGLPGMDGNELARRLRSEPETEHALLIALTGYGQRQDRQTAHDAGFDHFVSKPVDISQLIGVLNDFAMK